jgi:hypothetical protein
MANVVEELSIAKSSHILFTERLEVQLPIALASLLDNIAMYWFSFFLCHILSSTLLLLSWIGFENKLLAYEPFFFPKALIFAGYPRLKIHLFL